MCFFCEREEKEWRGSVTWRATQSCCASSVRGQQREREGWRARRVEMSRPSRAMASMAGVGDDFRRHGSERSNGDAAEVGPFVRAQRRRKEEDAAVQFGEAVKWGQLIDVGFPCFVLLRDLLLLQFI